ncbi:unnamed protein product, partial [Brassica rapa]
TPTDVLCVLNRQPMWAKITQAVHGKGQRAESKDQRADICTEGQSQTSYSPRGPKSPKQSTGRASVLSPRTNVLICVLMDSHRHSVCADGHTRTDTDSHGRHVQPTWAKITRTVHGKGQRADIHGRPVCADGQPRTATDVLCVLADTHGRPVQPTWAKITQTVLGKGHHAESTNQHADIQPTWAKITRTVHVRASVLSPRTNVLICVLMDSHIRLPRMSCLCWQTPTDVLCVLNRQPTWAKITQRV